METKLVTGYEIAIFFPEEGEFKPRGVNALENLLVAAWLSCTTGFQWSDDRPE